MGILKPSEVTIIFDHGKKWGGRVIDRRFMAEDDSIVANTAIVVKNRRGLSTIVLEGDNKLRIGEKIEVVVWTAEDWETKIPIIVMNQTGEFVFERHPHERPFSFTTFGNIFDPQWDFCDSEYDPAMWFTMSTHARHAFAKANAGIYSSYKTGGFEFGLWTPNVIYGGASYWESVEKE